MTIRSILCIFGGSENELNAVHAALVLGKSHNAHIRFLHISPTPENYAGLYGEGIMATGAIIDALERENDVRAEQAKKHIEILTAKYHVPLNKEDSPAHHVSAKFVRAKGLAEAIITPAGRMSDLIVIGRSEAYALYDAAIVAALFDTGRPVMLLPSKTTDTHGEYRTIALAWKESQEAARALYNSMPFLEQAENVHVLTAIESGKQYDLKTETRIMEYLHAHNVQAQGMVISTGSHPPAEAILTRAKELQCELLVMGAYGHSRVREMVLGGVTNHMIEYADIPLLLSH